MERKNLILLFALALVSIAALEARLFYLQVVKFGEFEEYRRARSHLELLQPLRGEIRDRNGKVLARDDRAFALDVVLEDFEKDPAVRVRLERLTGVPIEEPLKKIGARIERLASMRPEKERRAIVRRERRTPYPLAPVLTFEQAFEIDANAAFYGGLVVRERLRRTYPEGVEAAHVLGYPGKIQENETDLIDHAAIDDVLGPDGMTLLAARGAFQECVVGRCGVEQAFDARLRGSPGLVIHEKPAGGKGEVRVDLLTPSAGEPLTLTIDIDLQKKARAAMGGRPGAAIVMDVSDGSILAMVSEPAFDPNHFVSPTTQDALQYYFQPDAGHPMMNRAIGGRFNAGSIFKIVTTSAALEQGVVARERVIECKGRWDRRYSHLNCMIYNVGGSSHGPLNLMGAMERSCNIYFYTLAAETGMGTLAEWASRFGFGIPTGISLPSEKRGFLPTAGRETDAAQLGIGQSMLLVTPMQVAVMTGVIAGGGDALRPRIVADEPVDRRPSTVSPSTIAIVRDGLWRVVHGPAGTARNRKLQEMKVAGKTGSAQNPGGDSHAWFAGYLPFDAPRYVIVVFLEHGGHGGSDAGPVAAAIAEALK